MSCDCSGVCLACQVLGTDAESCEDGVDVVEGGGQIILLDEGFDFEEGAVDLGDADEGCEHFASVGLEVVIAAAFFEGDERHVPRPRRMACAASASSTRVSCSGLDPEASSTAAALYVRIVRVPSVLCTVRTRSSSPALSREPSGRS